MEAVVCSDFNSSEVVDISRPEPGDDEVLIQVNNLQLSVTECMRYRGIEISRHEDIVARLQDGPAQLFGHEFSGTVVESGPSVTEFEIGERVFAPGKIVCNECYYCLNGHSIYCENKAHLGSDVPGALAEYVTVPEHALCALPENVSNAEGAALQPLASSFSSVYDAKIDSGETVAVIGTGVMGNQCGQLALEEGAGKVFAIDLVPEKLDLAEENGMIPVNLRETDPVTFVRQQTNGVGVDVVFEAVGGEQESATDGNDPLALAFEMVRYGGRIVQTSHIIGDITLRPRSFRSKSVSWINPRKGVFPLGMYGDAGKHVTELVASRRVSVGGYIQMELDGLRSFEQAVEITLNKEDHEVLGPPQIVVSR